MEVKGLTLWPQSHIKVTRIKEIITNWRGSWLLYNSPYHRLRKCIGNSLENIHTDVRVLRNELTLKSWLDNQIDQDFASVHISSFELKYINYSSCHISLSYLFGSYMYIQGCSWRRSQVVKIRIELAKRRSNEKWCP